MRQETQKHEEAELPFDAVDALMELLGDTPNNVMVDALQFAQRVLEICHANNLHPLDLAEFFAGEQVMAELAETLGSLGESLEVGQ